MNTKKSINELCYQIVGAAIEVHKAIGPGLLESVYHKCLKQELYLRNIPFSSEHYVNLEYKGVDLETELRCDLLVSDVVAVELKSLEAFAPVHEAKLLTYMNLLKAPKGLLFNFTCINLYKEGHRALVNELFRQLPDY